MFLLTDTSQLYFFKKREKVFNCAKKHIRFTLLTIKLLCGEFASPPDIFPLYEQFFCKHFVFMVFRPQSLKVFLLCSERPSSRLAQVLPWCFLCVSHVNFYFDPPRTYLGMKRDGGVAPAPRASRLSQACADLKRSLLPE